MYLIGTMNLKLKIWLAIPVLFSLLCWSNNARAFDRDLTPDEVTKLEENAADDPKNVIARRFLIEHYSKEQNWKKVSQYSQGILAELTPAVLLKVTAACLESDDGPGAVAAIGAYHAKAPPTAATKTYEGMAIAKTAKREFKDTIRKQKAQGAIDVFKDAADQWPKEPAPYLGWIATLHDFWPSNADDILQVYKKLENSTGDFESYLIEKCELFVKANLWEQALVNCQRAIKKHPGDVDSVINLAQAQKVKINIEAAKKTLTQVIADHPLSAKAHRVFADLCMEETNFITAAEHYRLAINDDKDDTDSYLGLARANFSLKKYQEALDAYKQHCHLSRSVASDFKNAEGQLRIGNNPLHLQYKAVMSSCR